MQFMTSNAQLEIPKGEIRRYSMGGTHSGFLAEIFGEWPENEPEKDADPRREKAKKAIGDLLMGYYHERVFDRFIYDGYLDGLTHMDRLLAYYSFENAVRKAHVLVHERLAAIDHIEAVFFTCSEPEERRRKRINQAGVEISEMESYIFALREGLKYGLVLALSLSADGHEQPAVASFYSAEVDFVMNEQPKLMVKHLSSLKIQTTEVMAHGVPDFLDFLNTISMFEVWKREDKSLYDHIKDPVENRFKRVHARKDLQVLFVKALRANKQMFHLMRFGCGFSFCRPAQGNLVLDCSVPAENVPSCHVADALNSIQNPVGSRIDWWM